MNLLSRIAIFKPTIAAETSTPADVALHAEKDNDWYIIGGSEYVLIVGGAKAVEVDETEIVEVQS